MTCPDCGSRIKHGMVTCPVCGRKIRTATRTDRDYWLGDEHVREYTIDYGDEDPGLRDKLFDYAAEGAIALVAIAIAVTLYTWWFRHSP